MKIENRQKMLVIATIAALGLLIGDNFVFEPLVNWWASRTKEIAELRTQVKNGKSLIAREQGVRSHWKEMLDNTLPDNTAVAEHQLISAITRWSRETGVEVSGIMPQWKNDNDDYRTLNCRVEVSGTISTLSQFLYAVEQGPMALKLDSMELSVSSHDEGGQLLTLGIQVSGLALITSKP